MNKLNQYLIKCPTSGDAVMLFEFLEKAKSTHFEWWSGESNLSVTNWNIYRERTVYAFVTDRQMGDDTCYVVYGDGRNLIPFFGKTKEVISVIDFFNLHNKKDEENPKKVLDTDGKVCYNCTIVEIEDGATVEDIFAKTVKSGGKRINVEKENNDMCKKNHAPVTEVIDFTYQSVKQPFTEVGRIIDKSEPEPIDYKRSKAFMLGEKKERIIHTGNKTICIISHTINGKSKSFKGEAYCCRKDKYDKIKGIKIAYLRAKINALVEELETLCNE